MITEIYPTNFGWKINIKYPLSVSHRCSPKDPLVWEFFKNAYVIVQLTNNLAMKLILINSNVWRYAKTVAKAELSN